MTKFASVLFASLMALSLAACGGSQPKADDSASTSTTKKPLKKFSGGRLEAADEGEE